MEPLRAVAGDCVGAVWNVRSVLILLESPGEIEIPLLKEQYGNRNIYV